MLEENKLGSLIGDLTVLSRYLIVVPLFILAELGTIFRLGQIARHFVDAGIITALDRPRFEGIVAQARRLLDSVTVEVLVVALAYLAMIILIRVFPDQDIPLWHKAGDGGRGYSWAGWWHALVSAPVALVLLLGWLWRILIWGLFLFRVSRLDLQLVPAHPDLVGGLQFVGLSLRAFSLLSFAISASAAGGVAQRVLYHWAASFFSFIYVIAAVVILSLVLFVAPLLVFGGKLVEARRRGILDYGGLAEAVGSQLEQKWLDDRKNVDEGALDVPHFSATTDLYQVVSNVYQMKPFPIDTQDLIALIVVSLAAVLAGTCFSRFRLTKSLSDLDEGDVLAGCRPTSLLILDQRSNIQPFKSSLDFPQRQRVNQYRSGVTFRFPTLMSKTKPTIAIVDDDASVCRAISRLLRSLGMNADTFTSGHEFIKHIQTMPSFRPDCVVLDVQMPGMNGLEVQELLSP